MRPVELSEYEHVEYAALQLQWERERTMLELERDIGPRPSVATVLRAMRLRRGGRR